MTFFLFQPLQFSWEGQQVGGEFIGIEYGETIQPLKKRINAHEYAIINGENSSAWTPHYQIFHPNKCDCPKSRTSILKQTNSYAQRKIHEAIRIQQKLPSNSNYDNVNRRDESNKISGVIGLNNEICAN